MLGNILPPYHSLQELNLDWILTKVKNILRFVPDDGAVGQILRRTSYGAEWSDEQGGGAVESVNGQTGTVVLDAADVGALPDSYVAPVTSVNGQTGAVSIPIPDSTSDLINDSGFVNAAGAAAAAPVQSVNGQTGDVVISGGGAVDSVNGQTGTVVLDAADVGALPDSYVAPVTSVNGQTGAVSISIPDSTSDLINDSGFVNAAGAAAAAPVHSVNGQTGAVVIPTGTPLDAYPVGSIYMSVNSTNPGTLFGGTWEQLENRFLLAAGSDYAAGTTGGEAEHTLTVDEIPAHSHKWPSKYSTNVGAYIWYTPWTNNAGTIDAQVRAHTEDAGGGQAHNNMPPYLAVYMWKRTA